VDGFDGIARSQFFSITKAARLVKSKKSWFEAEREGFRNYTVPYGGDLQGTLSAVAFVDQDTLCALELVTTIASCCAIFLS